MKLFYSLLSLLCIGLFTSSANATLSAERRKEIEYINKHSQFTVDQLNHDLAILGHSPLADGQLERDVSMFLYAKQAHFSVAIEILGQLFPINNLDLPIAIEVFSVCVHLANTEFAFYKIPQPFLREFVDSLTALRNLHLSVKDKAPPGNWSQLYPNLFQFLNLMNTGAAQQITLFQNTIQPPFIPPVTVGPTETPELSLPFEVLREEMKRLLGLADDPKLAEDRRHYERIRALDHSLIYNLDADERSDIIYELTGFEKPFEVFDRIENLGVISEGGRLTHEVRNKAFSAAATQLALLFLTSETHYELSYYDWVFKKIRPYLSPADVKRVDKFFVIKERKWAENLASASQRMSSRTDAYSDHSSAAPDDTASSWSAGSEDQFSDSQSRLSDRPSSSADSADEKAALTPPFASELSTRLDTANLALLANEVEKPSTALDASTLLDQEIAAASQVLQSAAPAETSQLQSTARASAENRTQEEAQVLASPKAEKPLPPALENARTNLSEENIASSSVRRKSRNQRRRGPQDAWIEKSGHAESVKEVAAKTSENRFVALMKARQQDQAPKRVVSPAAPNEKKGKEEAVSSDKKPIGKNLPVQISGGVGLQVVLKGQPEEKPNELLLSGISDKSSLPKSEMVNQSPSVAVKSAIGGSGVAAGLTNTSLLSPTGQTNQISLETGSTDEQLRSAASLSGRDQALLTTESTPEILSEAALPSTTVQLKSKAALKRLAQKEKKKRTPELNGTSDVVSVTHNRAVRSPGAANPVTPNTAIRAVGVFDVQAFESLKQELSKNPATRNFTVTAQELPPMVGKWRFYEFPGVDLDRLESMIEGAFSHRDPIALSRALIKLNNKLQKSNIEDPNKDIVSALFIWKLAEVSSAQIEALLYGDGPDVSVRQKVISGANELLAVLNKNYFGEWHKVFFAAHAHLLLAQQKSGSVKDHLFKTEKLMGEFLATGIQDHDDRELYDQLYQNYMLTRGQFELKSKEIERALETFLKVQKSDMDLLTAKQVNILQLALAECKAVVAARHSLVGGGSVESKDSHRSENSGPGKNAEKNRKRREAEKRKKAVEELIRSPLVPATETDKASDTPSIPANSAVEEPLESRFMVQHIGSDPGDQASEIVDDMLGKSMLSIKKNYLDELESLMNTGAMINGSKPSDLFFKVFLKIVKESDNDWNKIDTLTKLVAQATRIRYNENLYVARALLEMLFIVPNIEDITQKIVKKYPDLKPNLYIEILAATFLDHFRTISSKARKDGTETGDIPATRQWVLNELLASGVKLEKILSKISQVYPNDEILFLRAKNMIDEYQPKRRPALTQGEQKNSIDELP